MKSGQQNNSLSERDDMNRRAKSREDSLLFRKTLSGEEKKSILKSRAHILAKEEHNETNQQEYTEIVEFRLASENYAFETAFVREVYLLNNYTTLPGIPDFILGIVNIRGQIISVIDLKKLFNLPATGLGELNKIIVLQNGKMEFGILADVIIGSYPILLKDSGPLTIRNMNGSIKDYLKGVTSSHLIILDARKILEDKKLRINQIAE